jgi:hypothetical protein
VTFRPAILRPVLQVKRFLEVQNSMRGRDQSKETKCLSTTNQNAAEEPIKNNQNAKYRRWDQGYFASKGAAPVPDREIVGWSLDDAGSVGFMSESHKQREGD